MKKYRLLLSILLKATLLSCTSGNDDTEIPNENEVIPLRYTIIESEGSNDTFNFEYMNKLIKKLDNNFGKTTIYNYNGNQLTGFETIESNDTLVTNLIYENNRLSELRTEDENLIVLYTHNDSGQVISTERNENGKSTTTTYEYDTSGNVILAQDNFSTLKYTYNERNNPFKNVFPQLDAEITWEWFGSQINLQQEVQEKLTSETEFTTKYTYQYTFDDPNYFPSERRQLDKDGNLIETVIYYYGE
ncbi:hypothetical protein [Marixanthomonas spongiae]|uniref:YD repeat-containing protein n=1 Tax=Marixanthomonas spongiae TaxID=2174845 RepID=A0A2U0I544_9FLAO|nr:hypothetical protein [Marixanthomonas spongiae]PVW16227.1 hypothetical protein DDV96_02855 [Marixanthomonas spongiae]